MIEGHIEKLRAYPRPLSRRAFSAQAPEHPRDIGETRRPERRPAEQPRAENAERDGDGEFAPDAGKSRDRQRQYAADDLDRARQHSRIGRTKHLQQRIEQDNGDDAGDQSRHELNIGGSAAKSMSDLAAQKRANRKAPGRQPCEFVIAGSTAAKGPWSAQM